MITIAIPTYNRIHHLSRRINELTPQMREDTQVVIFDNGSTDGTQEYLSTQDDPRISFKTWPSNRGICRNFMRLFEEAQGDWIWMLSDDDPIRPDALSRIRDAIGSCSNGILAFKAQGNSISTNSIYESLPSFLNDQQVMDLSYISGLVFHHTAITAGLPILAGASYTMLPHAMLAFAALLKGFPIRTFSDELLIPQEGMHRVSRREFLQGVAAFPSFFEDEAVRNEVSRQLRSSSRWMVFSSLAQLTSATELSQWRSTVRITQCSFAANNAGLLESIMRSKSIKNMKRELLITILLFLPNCILLKIAGILSRKTGQSSLDTHKDSSI